MKILINYANLRFRASQRLNSRNGLAVAGFDKVFSFGPRDLDPAFRRANASVLAGRRGNGWWLWKPYVILKVLDLARDGDILFYSDSASTFIASLEPLFDLCRNGSQDVIPFDVNLSEMAYTKRDCFVLMGCDSPEYAETTQRLSGHILLRKSEAATDFIRAWLRHAQDSRIITDKEGFSGLPNHPGFVAHRHDQSVFSLLTKKHGFEAFRDPSQFGNHLQGHGHNSPYPQLIDLYRQPLPHLWYGLRRRMREGPT